MTKPTIRIELTLFMDIPYNGEAEQAQQIKENAERTLRERGVTIEQSYLEYKS